ncbi:hypothetical protein EVAR_24902_1 [Eumeta japonica]|uniref:Uncharacterized protein n=1 Tax=Eumeta variegata TaxID=151549 RepID=A0A4C1V591_EUMVA|nr:hypothetical protein EVAR_24902_1 [Eumeta japonica]
MNPSGGARRRRRRRPPTASRLKGPRKSLPTNSRNFGADRGVHVDYVKRGESWEGLIVHAYYYVKEVFGTSCGCGAVRRGHVVGA